MTQSPPDKMPDIIYLLHGTGDYGSHTWCTDPDPTGYVEAGQRTRYINAATLADDLAEIEGFIVHDMPDAALTIIRRLRGNQ